MTCNDTINNKTIVSTLAYVKQKMHGTGANRGAGHFLSKTQVCVTGYNSVLLQLSWHAIMLWYHVLELLGEHIPIRVNIKRVQTQLNTQVLHVTVEGHNHARTENVRPIGNMYHDRIFDHFTEGKTSKRKEEMHSYIHAQLQMP